MRLLVLVALIATALPLPAHAIPGQSTAAFLKWLHANPAFAHVRPVRDEMSGGTMYQADVKFGSKRGLFSAEPVAGNAIRNETVAVQRMPDSYDLRKHREVGAALLGRVYGSAIGADFTNAKVAGDFSIFQAPMRTALYRGVKFAYHVTGVRLDVLPLSSLAEALKAAKQCQTMQCGD